METGAIIGFQHMFPIHYGFIYTSRFFFFILVSVLFSFKYFERCEHFALLPSHIYWNLMLGGIII